jgi:uncharacterized membrane protein (UPF0127 family)
LIFLQFQLSVISAETICSYNPDATISINTSTKEKLSFTTGIAETDEKHVKGLMNCKELKKGTGLFFIFNDDAPRYFWMKNTSLELAIIYIDSDYKVISIKKGIPFNESTLPSIFPARFVLEINWNESGRIKPGDKISFKMN